MELFSVAFTLFLVMNVLGIIPAFLKALEPVPITKRPLVLVREMCFVLGLMLLFGCFGKLFFHWLQIDDTTLSMAGGIILFFIGIRMIFPDPRFDAEYHEPSPCFVPIAFPIISGPSVLAAMMFYSDRLPIKEGIFATIIAWAAAFIILSFGTRIKALIGDKGLNALQRLMGLLLTLISVHFFLTGLIAWVQILKGQP